MSYQYNKLASTVVTVHSEGMSNFMRKILLLPQFISLLSRIYSELFVRLLFKLGSRRAIQLLCVLPMLVLAQPSFSLGDTSYIAHSPVKGVQIADGDVLADIIVDNDDYSGLKRAVGDLQQDIHRVTGKLPVVRHQPPAERTNRHAVIVGSIERSDLIQSMVASGKLDIASMQGEWEAYRIQTVANPLPNIDEALVIVGSDMRGAIFGVYDLSQQIGVSPWYWWADVPVNHQSVLYVPASTSVSEQPKVQYRGIFLNDEAPALTNWVHENYGNYNSKFYPKVFELLLRLKANFLWPAMWNNSFSVDDPLNPELANEYGIVMSTSHHEPMMRAHKEWKGYGAWDFSKNAEGLKQFWREGVERNSPYENIITLAMRGDGDEAMSEEANVSLLEGIVDAQREIISEVFADKGKKVDQVPQVWCLYKEVQDYYEQGMRVPDDVILLWADDNWGNIRRLPTPEERARSGGAGVYYHFDYVGGPRSYRWINSTPIAKIWEQMNLAYEYEANRIWIVNVGDLKPMEVPIEYFLEMAWNPEQWPKERIGEFSYLWAEREFGKTYAKEIAELVTEYVKHNGQRKPELMDGNVYSLLNYDEAERVERRLNRMEERALAIFEKLPQAQQDAYYQLVLHPVLATATVTKMHIAHGRNQLYAKQGRPLANDYAKDVQALFEKDARLTQRYHSINGGKWNHFMSQPHIGYTYWNNPEANTMPAISHVTRAKGRDMGVAVEGVEKAWPMDDGDYTLPTFTPYGKTKRVISVFNKGDSPLTFTVAKHADWLMIEEQTTTIVNQELHLDVKVDWSKVPEGEHTGHVSIKGPSWVAANITVKAEKPSKFKPLKRLSGFVEGDGVISFEAASYSKLNPVKGHSWQEIEQHGRTQSSMSVFPVTDTSYSISNKDDLSRTPSMEYTITLLNDTEVVVHGLFAPTWPIQPNRGLKYAIAFDNEKPVVVDVLEHNEHADWQESVRKGVRTAFSKHTLKAGKHTMKVWAIDPAVTVQKWILDAGGLKDSYLGPQPSRQGGK